MASSPSIARTDSGTSSSNRVRTPCGHRHDTLIPRSPYVNRQPFGKCHRRVLGDGIRRRANLRQQSGRGCRLQEITFAGGEHHRQDRARRVDVRHQVDLPDALPLVVRGRVERSRNGNARIRAEQIDAPVRIDGGSHDAGHIRLETDVGPDGHAADLCATSWAAESMSATTTARAPSREKR